MQKIMKEHGSVPDSCCKDMKTSCGKGILDMEERKAKEMVFDKGCHDKIGDFLKESYANVGYALTGLIVAQCLAQLLNAVVANTIIKSRKRNDAVQELIS